jgi:hypothetical protein
MNKINTEGLKDFILQASRATYASGDESIKEKQPDGSTTIRFANGEYKFHDNYFGGEPYGGREVIFLNDKPIWMMVYYGFVHPDVEAKSIYGFLAKSLSNSKVEMPYRGPKLFQEGNLKYQNDLVGDTENFSGTEKIFRDDVCVYEASYIGGFVDQ